MAVKDISREEGKRRVKVERCGNGTIIITENESETSVKRMS